MVVSEGTLARPSQRRSAAIPAALVVAGVLLVALLVVGRFDGQVVRVAAAGVACWLMWRGLAAVGSVRERKVRAWISFEVVVWALSEAVRLSGVLDADGPLFAGVTVGALSIGAVGTYVAAARDRMRRADEAALYPGPAGRS